MEEVSSETPHKSNRSNVERQRSIQLAVHRLILRDSGQIEPSTATLAAQRRMYTDHTRRVTRKRRSIPSPRQHSTRNVIKRGTDRSTHLLVGELLQGPR